MEKPRPIWGFTWRGWVLLAIAVALAVVLVSGVDVNYLVLKLLNDTLGVPAMFAYTQYVLIPHWLWTTSSIVPDPALGILQCTLLLVGLQLHPRPVSTPAVVACAVWAISGQPLLWYGFAHPPAWGRTGNWIAYLVASALLLVWVTRSRVVVGGFVALVVVHFLVAEFMWDEFQPWVWNLVWNVAFFGVVLAWAVPARRERAALLGKGRPCPSCGYDLAGLKTDGVCPECGAAGLLAPVEGAGA